VGSHTPRAVQAAGGHADLVRALFDTKAAGWPAKYAAGGRLAGRLAPLARAVGDLVAPGGEVLDLGCGSGELARRLGSDGYQVTGCDIAPEMLRQAEAADVERVVRWIQLEPCWRVLPFPASGLDAVVTASVLEYLPDSGAVLAECARVLRPGGVLVCTVPNVAHPVRWAEWPLRLAARTAPAAALGAVAATSRRSTRYLTYLRVSCQRRPVGWWYSAARQAGFEPVSAERTARQPLRLLTFVLPAETAGQRPTAPEEA
jgi:SAM-dependent methyltransferase